MLCTGLTGAAISLGDALGVFDRDRRLAVGVFGDFGECGLRLASGLIFGVNMILSAILVF